MKRYIIAMIFLLLVALMLSVVVYYIVMYYQTRLPVGTVVVKSSETLATTSVIETPMLSTATSTDANTVPTMTYEPIFLRDLSLTPAQITTVKVLGLDPATAEITPAMQACAAVHLGEVRLSEIIAGTSPTVGELLQLRGCL